jgi:6-pyruvoyltetrahydropterin/6-carboxytetrahydropterin synthase
MLQVTKIFRFETAHALHGYAGSCKNIHGHSYELHVTVREKQVSNDYLPGTGILIDFKDIKRILSKAYIAANPGIGTLSNLHIWEVEPSAENILIYIQKILQQKLPDYIHLMRLKIYETAESYAEWTAC